jgi:hypothetical protein
VLSYRLIFFRPSDSLLYPASAQTSLSMDRWVWTVLAWQFASNTGIHVRSLRWSKHIFHMTEVDGYGLNLLVHTTKWRKICPELTTGLGLGWDRGEMQVLLTRAGVSKAAALAVYEAHSGPPPLQQMMQEKNQSLCGPSTQALLNEHELTSRCDSWAQSS